MSIHGNQWNPLKNLWETIKKQWTLMTIHEKSMKNIRKLYKSVRIHERVNENQWKPRNLDEIQWKSNANPLKPMNINEYRENYLTPLKIENNPWESSQISESYWESMKIVDQIFENHEKSMNNKKKHNSLRWGQHGWFEYKGFQESSGCNCGKEQLRCSVMII